MILSLDVTISPVRAQVRTDYRPPCIANRVGCTVAEIPVRRRLGISGSQCFSQIMMPVTLCKCHIYVLCYRHAAVEFGNGCGDFLRL